MNNAFNIGGKPLGEGAPALIIAEAGVNHGGDMDLARRLVDAAAQAGADAVKFQTFRAESLAVAGAPKARYQQETTGAGESQVDMLRRLELPFEAHAALVEHCRQRGIMFLSTPYDEESAALLHGLGVPAFKIPSGELTNLPFLEHLASLGRPMILSTGAADLQEVRDAVSTVRRAGGLSPGQSTHPPPPSRSSNARAADPEARAAPLCLLHCVSCYPADPADANLRAMDTLRREFHVPVGYSDHTPGMEVALAAVALGACVLEKHFTLDRRLPGPDHRSSLEPSELAALVRGVRAVESAMGDGRKMPRPAELGNRDVARKSVVTIRAVPKGTTIRRDMLAIKRPGTGLAPARLGDVVGKTARVDLPAGVLLRWEDVE